MVYMGTSDVFKMILMEIIDCGVFAVEAVYTYFFLNGSMAFVSCTF